MFGFVVANPEKLSEEEKLHYKAVYCGICEDLGRDRKFRNRCVLTYDLVFLAIVLSAVTGEKYEVQTGRCPVHPLKKRQFERNSYTSYAADMNIALAYYKFLDDIADDNSISAKIKAAMFKHEEQKISIKYPRQCRAIVKNLKELSEIEKKGILIPDIPAAAFGRLLGEIFAVNKNRDLYNFGAALGKFIYIADAATDLKQDIKHQKYNPLVRCRKCDIEPILSMLLADCVKKYRELPVKQDKEIIENVLFSGVWTVYMSRSGRKEKDSEQKSL